MMSIRSLFAGFFIIAGCSTAMMVAAAFVVSIQLDNGTGLLVGVGALLGSALALALGFLILLYRD